MENLFSYIYYFFEDFFAAIHPAIYEEIEKSNSE